MPEQKANEMILFVSNPISGDIDKEDLKEEIRDFMKSQHRPEKFYDTTGKNDKENILHAIENYKPSTVVAIGGDGTCNLVAQAVIKKQIKMGIIPLGSANGLATELNLPNKPEENMKLITLGKSKKIDVLNLNNSYISLHLSDIGFNAQMIKTYEEGETRGLTGYIKSFVDEFGEATPAGFEIACDNEIINTEAFMLVIANATKFGTGALINPTGKIDDGYFEIVVVQPQNFSNFLQMLIPFYAGSIHTLDFVKTYKCKKVKIMNREKQNLQIDGEIIGQPKQIDVEIMPRSLEIIIP
ncbi:MAG: YegS/Rv2252/BmrU family lipid kinase [Prolixibacteraceae bacterium]|nr:YegS/Rv2252/BmrU family lipid kinase [Prolixibacteraceae bacterium]